MNSYNSISEIIKDLQKFDNQAFTAEEVSQYLRIRLEETLKNGSDLLPLSIVPVKLNY